MLRELFKTKGRVALLLGALAYASFFIFMLLVRPGTKESYHAFFNVYQGIPPLFAGIVGLFHGIKSTGQRDTVRWGWGLIGVGCLSFAIGQGTWTYFETIKGVEVPFPGPPDVGYLGTYPCLIVGVLLLFTDVQAVAGRARILMDGAIAACSVGMLSWYFMIGHLWSKSDVPTLGKLIGVAYPLGDIASLFVGLVALVGAGSDRSYRRVFSLLSIGVVMLTLADSVFIFKGLNEGYETGSWNDWGWSFGWTLIGFAPLMQRWLPATNAATRKPREKLQALGNTIRTFAPYVVAIASLTVIFAHDYSRDHKIGSNSYGAALFLLSLILFRQVFMVMENIALTRRVADMNDSLENMVADRTRKLTGLQSLAKQVNATLSAEEVVLGAIQQAQRILGADAVALCLDRGDEGRPIKAASLMGEAIQQYPKVVRSLDGRSPVREVEQFQVFGSEAPSACLVGPLRWHSETIGQIVAVRKAGQFNREDAEMLESVGVEIGTALKNSWRHEDALAAADRDSVTGLLNHRALHQRMTRELAAAEAAGTKASIVMMDMNNFKLFNDTYGHVVGDSVLKAVAEKLTLVCGDRGLPARYGGDEFAALLPGMDSDGAERLALAIKDSLDALDYARADDDRKIPISLTFGIATFPTDGRNRLELLTVADRNLYHAKSSESGIGRTSEGQRQNRELRAQGSFETLDILVDSIDNKDRYTRKHSEDVTEYALWIAEELGMSEDTMRTIRMAGLLHDVGKIGVPDEVLRKPGRLTAEEYEIMKRHPRLGELIVGALPGMEGVVDGVRSHHERWDGEGYPDGLAGDDIPLLGRILAVGDAFSAMTTDRPYRKGMGWDTALDQIRVGMGTQFDPFLASAFLKAVAKRRGEPSDLRVAA